MWKIIGMLVCGLNFCAAWKNVGARLRTLKFGIARKNVGVWGARIEKCWCAGVRTKFWLRAEKC
jgi:hypothetical protein